MKGVGFRRRGAAITASSNSSEFGIRVFRR